MLGLGFVFVVYNWIKCIKSPVSSFSDTTLLFEDVSILGATQVCAGENANERQGINKYRIAFICRESF